MADKPADLSSPGAYLSSLQRGALRDAKNRADRAAMLRKTCEELTVEADRLEAEADILTDAAKRIKL